MLHVVDLPFENAWRAGALRPLAHAQGVGHEPAMKLVQILLPVFDNGGEPLPKSDFDRTRTELAERFGGLTAFSRAPAEGLWKQREGRTARDDIVVLEVMVEHLDRPWWDAYRRTLEHRFRQDAIVVRAHTIELL